MSLVSRFFVAAGALPLILATAGVGADGPAPVEVRVGVVAYEDFGAEFSHWQAVFSELSHGHQPPLDFVIAAGTYGDVLHWIERQLVDVAVLTPGVFAETLAGDDEAGEPIEFQYLATVRLPPAVSKWSEADRRRAGYHDWYRSVCVVAAASRLKTAEDLRRAAERSRVQFVFVHPFSVSGRIAPEFALRSLGVVPTRQHVEFTNSHTGSLRVTARPAAETERVAFVWDDALAATPGLTDSVRRLEFAELDSLQIPHDVIVARRGFEHLESLEVLLTSHIDSAGARDFHRMGNWSRQYEVVRQWCRAIGLSKLSREAQAVTLNEIGQTLLHHARSQPKPPRLAVVLSGGGAKCSYQVGAVAALEEELAGLRRQNPDCGLDIALVVGTSGGAINSVPVVLGVTSTTEGRADFQQVWKELDQRDIVRPATVVRANIGLWFALFQAACVLWFVRRLIKRPRRRGWVVCGTFVALGAIQITAGYVHVSPWPWLGQNHLTHHVWLWCTFGIRASAWCVLGAGLVGLLSQGCLLRRGKFLEIPARPAAWGLLVCLLALPIVQVVTVLFFQKTLSGGEGMEHALAWKFPHLVDRHVQRQGRSSLELADISSDARRLEATSRQIFERGLLRRDLVITGNCLEQSGDTLPSDVYFYASADAAGPSPPFGPRGISLRSRPSILLDVVLGSSSIFPVFPPRRLRDFPQPGGDVELVDGGFAHNSPIEAAVLWGATHVVLIEATPEKRRLRRNFVENAATAFTHLHRQTQLVDVRSKRQVVVFTLTPQPPHMCVLDFADNLIEASIEQGYRDARGEVEQGIGTFARFPRFRKELGEPVFTEGAARRVGPSAGGF